MTKFLIYFMIKIRPDIAFATFIVSCFTKNLFCQHIKTVKKIIKYLKSIKLIEIPYNKKARGGDFTIKKYPNSD